MCIIIAIHRWLGYAIVWNDSHEICIWTTAIAQDGNFKVPAHACTHYMTPGCRWLVDYSVSVTQQICCIKHAANMDIIDSFI